jgi:molybdenum cofactor synthesis domain-containing protein
MHACLIIIGNEILSGRTQDKNLSWLAAQLNALGIALRECRVVPDIEQEVIDAVNACRARYDYVFTTGGIGPTHDDITTACIAKAFGVSVIRHPEADRRLRVHYTPDQINEARMKMADVPEGATLIDNPVSAAPGYSIGNVYVMAGVPRIMQAMFEGIKHTLKGGAPMLSSTISAYVTEGTIAAELTATQLRFPDVEIGSYPFIRDGKLGTSLVARTPDATRLAACSGALQGLIAAFDAEILAE